MSNMKKVLGVILAFSPASMLWADSGNQLMKNQVHWYETAAQTVGPVEGVKTDGGTVFNIQPGSHLYLEGDSTLHKYQMAAKTLIGTAVVKVSASESLAKAVQGGRVESMTLVIPLKTFNSRESGLDDNAYKALKAQDFPEITFNLTNEALDAGAVPDSYVMTAVGTLTVAGATAPVTLTADAAFQNNQVRLKGVQKLKMTDFKVTPPSISLLVTSITCTDAIQIHYDVTFAAK